MLWISVPRYERGITLIALIVTIILLLILSAITINLATKQNGIFNKAKIAQDKYDTAELKEKLEILKESLFMEDDNTERVVTLDMFLDAIRRDMGIGDDSIEKLDSKTAVITCRGGKKLILTEADGDVRIDYEGDIVSETSLWCIFEKNKANGMWLASPSNEDSERLMGVNYKGQVYYATTAGIYYGFRPIVYMPKSDL